MCVCVSTWRGCSGDETPSILDLSKAVLIMDQTDHDYMNSGFQWPGWSWFCQLGKELLLLRLYEQGLEISSLFESVPCRLVSEILWPQLCEVWRFRHSTEIAIFWSLLWFVWNLRGIHTFSLGVRQLQSDFWIDYNAFRRPFQLLLLPKSAFLLENIQITTNAVILDILKVILVDCTP